MGGRVFRWLYVMECVVGSFVHKCLFYFTGRTRQKNNNILVCVNWYIGSLRSNIYLYLNPFVMEFPFIVFVNVLFEKCNNISSYFHMILLIERHCMLWKYKWNVGKTNPSKRSFRAYDKYSIVAPITYRHEEHL